MPLIDPRAVPGDFSLSSVSGGNLRVFSNGVLSSVAGAVPADVPYHDGTGTGASFSSVSGITGRTSPPSSPTKTWNILFYIFEHVDASYVRSDGSTHHISSTLSSTTISELEDALSGPVQETVDTYSQGYCKWNIEVHRISEPVPKIASAGSYITPLTYMMKTLNADRPGYTDSTFYYFPLYDNGYYVPETWWGLTYPTIEGPGSSLIADSNARSWTSSSAHNVLVHEFLHQALLFFNLPDHLDDTAYNTQYGNDDSDYLKHVMRNEISPTTWESSKPRELSKYPILGST